MVQHADIDHSGVVGIGGVANVWCMNKSTSQTLTSNTLTAITFDTTVIDGGSSVIDLANDRFVAPATGFYLCLVNWIWETTTPTIDKYISIKVGSTESIPLLRGEATTASLKANGGLAGSGALSLTVGDFVTMHIQPGVATPTARGNASKHLATTFTLVRIT